MATPDTTDSSMTAPSNTEELTLTQSSGYQTLEEDDIATEDFMETGGTSETSDSEMSAQEDESEGDVISRENFLQDLKGYLKLGEYDRITKINGVVIDESTNIQELLKGKHGKLLVTIIKDDSMDIEADNDKVELLEVMLTYHKCDSTVNILIHKILHRKPYVYDIHFKESKDDCICCIRSVQQTGKFLTCSNGKLTLSPIESLINDESSKFKLYRFTAKQVADGIHSQIELRLFESISEKKFITAKYNHDVKLKKSASPTIQFQPHKPDGRFFKLLKSKEGYLFLESVVNHGTYLCFINGKIQLKIRNNIDTMIDADSSLPSHENELLYLGH